MKWQAVSIIWSFLLLAGQYLSYLLRTPLTPFLINQVTFPSRSPVFYMHSVLRWGICPLSRPGCIERGPRGRSLQCLRIACKKKEETIYETKPFRRRFWRKTTFGLRGWSKNPKASWITNTWPEQYWPAPMPMVGMCTLLVKIFPTSSGT